MNEQTCEKTDCEGDPVCDFQPRYDIKAPKNIASIPGIGDFLYSSDVINIAESLTDKIYVCDVCVRCGKIAKAPE